MSGRHSVWNKQTDDLTYQEIIRRLAAVYDGGEARAVTRMLLEDAFALTMADIACGAVEKLNGEDSARLENYVLQLGRGVPVQYVLGTAWFHDRPFAVTPSVLIPRPETELLADEAVRSVASARGNGQAGDSGKTRRRVLDIGTGSGCIAVTVAAEAPDAYVEAWDISTEALAVAERNARENNADVNFREVDVLAESERVSRAEDEETFDVIVSNPPYICDSEAVDMERNVLDYEPHTALFVPDDDPLLFYRAIARLSLSRLRCGGKLLFEINRAYGKETVEMLEAMGYADVRLMKDQYDNPRIVSCVRNSEPWRQDAVDGLACDTPLSL